MLSLKSSLIQSIVQSKRDLILQSASILRYDQEATLILKKNVFGKKTVLFPSIAVFSFIILFLSRKAFLNYRKIV